jgi:hypothetical protein
MLSSDKDDIRPSDLLLNVFWLLDDLVTSQLKELKQQAAESQPQRIT